MAFLSRILLALCVAFVFTGRMEAAASHCAKQASAKLAAASDQPAEPAEPPCHETAGAAASDTAGYHMAKPAKSPGLGDPADPCDCIAMIKAFSELPAIQLTMQQLPFRWQAPAAIAFASIVSDVERPPPRAA